MKLHRLSVTGIITIALAITLSSAGADKVTFEDDGKEERPEDYALPERQHQEPPSPLLNGTEFPGSEGRSFRQGKNLLDWIGLGTGQNIDPYLARTNEACLNGDFAECFKSRALNTFSDFFEHPQYNLNDHVKVVRMSRDIVQQVSRQPYEYVSTGRADESDWDQLVKFAMRKAERFVKTAAFEVDVPSWLTGDNEIYAPRFLDEVAEEIDIIDNKRDTLFSRNRLKKLFIPMLIILKLFKLKLLLFLPLILGLASFKKFLGLMAIAIPGIIGFLKICKPMTQSYTPPVYSQAGIGFPSGGFPGGVPYKEPDNHHYYVEPDHHHHHQPGSFQPYSSNHEIHSDGDRLQGSFQQYSSNREIQSDSDRVRGSKGDTVRFGQELAYQGYKVNEN